VLPKMGSTSRTWLRRSDGDACAVSVGCMASPLTCLERARVVQSMVRCHRRARPPTV
jgi:hypothetical protein